MRRLIALAAICWLVTTTMMAQVPPAATPTPVVQTSAPTVSDLDKQKVQTLALRIENAQLKAQAAQRDFDQARSDLAALVQSLQREGFTLDLQTLTYTKKPEPKAPEKKKEKS